MQRFTEICLLGPLLGAELNHGGTIHVEDNYVADRACSIIDVKSGNRLDGETFLEQCLS